MNTYNTIAAILLCRVFLGLLFFVQGIDKVVNIKIKGVADAFRYPETQLKMPGALVYLAAAYTSYIELLCGFLLIVGLFTSPSLYLLGIDLIIVSIGMAWKQPLWDMKFVWPRLVLLVFLLIMPLAYNVISIDHLLGIKY